MKKSMWDNKEKINDIIKEGINKTDVLRKLGLGMHGGNYNTLSRYIHRNNINIDHFEYNKPTVKKVTYKYDNINDILIKNSPYRKTSNLKKRLYKEGLKKRECELCGQNEEWKGKKMSLILDHINGDPMDNRLENLQIVCPNCNATLPTHCRGNRKKKPTHDQCECGKKKKIKSKICKTCNYKNLGKGKKKHNNQQYKQTTYNCTKCNKSLSDKRETALCIACYNKKRRKVTRPPYYQLLKEIKETNYSAVGRKYGVSDNAIRKWVKY